MSISNVAPVLTVYLFHEDDYDGHQIYGIYATFEAARAAMSAEADAWALEKDPKGMGRSLRIDEFSVDGSKSRRTWRVKWNQDKTSYSVEEF